MNIRNMTMVTLALLGAVAVAWWFGFIGGPDPAVAELQQMRDQMFASRDLPAAQRDQLRDQFRERLASLSDAQRRALFADGRERWRQRNQQRMDEFFALSPVDRRKQLDETIDRMLDRVRQRNQNPAAGDRQARRWGNGDGRRGRNMSQAQRDARAKRRLDRSTPKERAQRAEYRRQMRERMQERGIDPGKLPGRRRGFA
jgi:hypothetical protein